MKPGDEIFKNYDADDVAGLAYREADARKIAENLPQLFTENDINVPNNTNIATFLEASWQILKESISSWKAQVTVIQPYEEFEQNGVKYQSRISHIAVPEDLESGDIQVDLYLISLMADNEIFITPENSPLGLLVAADNYRQYFRIKKIIEEVHGDDPPGESDSEERAPYIHFDFEPLSPEEQFVTIDEFKKALKASDISY